MTIKILVTLEVNHVEGKFASKEELAEIITYELEPNSPIYTDHAEYTVDVRETALVP